MRNTKIGKDIHAVFAVADLRMKLQAKPWPRPMRQYRRHPAFRNANDIPFFSWSNDTVAMAHPA